jgi:hypothetical protein
MILKPHGQMTNEELKATVTVVAQWSAERTYLLRHPGAGAAARRYAGRHWQEYVDLACDILGLWEALGESQAAPAN